MRGVSRRLTLYPRCGVFACLAKANGCGSTSACGRTTWFFSLSLERLLRGAACAFGAVMIAATAVPLLRRNAWWIRVFDFPRLQITVISAGALALYLVLWDRE